MEIEEVGRKVIHLTSVFIVITYFILGKEKTLLFLVYLLIFFLVIEYIRIELNKKIPLFWRFFKEKEKKALGGEIYFVIGSIITISVFPMLVACTAILMTTFGDSIAGIVGKAIGKRKLRQRKSLEGCLAEFFVNLIIAFIILRHFFLAVVMAAVAAIAETLTLKLDDNLIIPIFSGFAGFLFLKFISQ